MYLKQFFVEGLGHASYLIASDQTREAAVVDQRRDVSVYVEEARREGACYGVVQVAGADAGLRFAYRGVRGRARSAAGG